MTDRRGDRQQQTGRCGQCCCETTRCDQTDDPAWQVGDFRVGQYQDIPVNDQLIAVPAAGFSRRREGFAVVVKLDTAVFVLVGELDKTSYFPLLDPVRTLIVLDGLR